MTPSKQQTFFALLGVFVCIVFAHAFGWLRPIENGVRFIFFPVSRFVYTLGAARTDTGTETASLTAWEKRLAKEQFDRAACDMAKAENVDLRNQLEFLHKEPYRTIGADIVGKEIETPNGTVVINRGSSDGVFPNQPVVAGDGVFIGKISKSDVHTAVITLVTGNESKIAATVLSQDKSIGLVEGGYDISIQMNFIPQNEVVNVGDVVITSGLESGVPRGLLIGTVAAVKKEVYQPFQQAVLTPILSLSKLTVVSVITQVGPTP